jgi:hypothetical protein
MRSFEFKVAKDYFIEKKKYNFFSRSNFKRGKGRVSDFFGHEDAEFLTIKKYLLREKK